MNPDQPASDSTVYYAAYVMAHGLVDMILTCFHLLKIASDSNFYFAFGENYEKNSI